MTPDQIFDQFDFPFQVKDHSGWEVAGNRHVKTVFEETEGDSIKHTFEVRGRQVFLDNERIVRVVNVQASRITAQCWAATFEINPGEEYQFSRDLFALVARGLTVRFWIPNEVTCTHPAEKVAEVFGKLK